VYINYCAVGLTIDYTPRCLEYVYLVYSTLRRHGYRCARTLRHLNRTICCQRAQCVYRI